MAANDQAKSQQKNYSGPVDLKSRPKTAPFCFSTNLQYLKGVGPKLAQILAKRNLKTFGDLVSYYPRTYEDRRAVRNISSLKENDTVSLVAMVKKINHIQMGKSHRKMTLITLGDSSGSITCKFFRAPFRGYFDKFASNVAVRVTGKVISYRGVKEFHHPDLRVFEEAEEIQDELEPIYPEIEIITSAKIKKMVRMAWELVKNTDELKEKIPQSILQAHHLPSIKQALEQLHFPDPNQAGELLNFKSQAHRRIIFEEFFWFEMYLAAKKTSLQKAAAKPLRTEGKLIQSFLQQLPFKLTGAQQRAFSEIQKDLNQNHAMNRLVQGDVGSGKTVVSFLAALIAVENKCQACLMVPTEILAEQHYKNATKLLSPVGVRVEILSGKTKAAKRSQLLEDLAEGRIDFLIGTHALIEDPVKFKDLQLVVIDEQHRFGVEQRGALKKKGSNPHFLVMTATPIPRTLAMTVYGDLEISIIDELPPGRSPIQTRVIFESKRLQALEFMRDLVGKGRQAYIIFPLIEESEKVDLKNAIEEYEKLKVQFPDLRFGLMHGKLRPEEKDSIMQAFRNHEFDVLVSTTVIEVGVDVPNANFIMVEHSERFGLSQLHQLRGRVGRGQHKSYCIFLLGYAVGEVAKERTAVLEQTNDGFKIAEYDLEFRGPGEFIGTRQSGLPGFKMANLVRDLDLLTKARESAFLIIQKDPRLSLAENQKIKEELLSTHGPAEMISIS